MAEVSLTVGQAIGQLGRALSTGPLDCLSRKTAKFSSSGPVDNLSGGCPTAFCSLSTAKGRTGDGAVFQSFFKLSKVPLGFVKAFWTEDGELFHYSIAAYCPLDRSRAICGPIGSKAHAGPASFPLLDWPPYSVRETARNFSHSPVNRGWILQVSDWGTA